MEELFTDMHQMDLDLKDILMRKEKIEQEGIMNFYLGSSIERLNVSEKNIELDDDMMAYLYSIKEKIPFRTFFTIDLYSDTVLEKKGISDILSMCEYLLKEQVLNDYDENEELTLAISELNDLCCNAVKQGEKIVVIGD